MYSVVTVFGEHAHILTAEFATYMAADHPARAGGANRPFKLPLQDKQRLPGPSHPAELGGPTVRAHAQALGCLEVSGPGRLGRQAEDDRPGTPSHGER
jgi:hypothetical protein